MMNVREWALVAFTILSQMAIGSMIVLGIVHFFAIRKAGMQEADRLSNRILPAIGIVLGAAMLISLGHLGSPLNAPLAVLHLSSSWLSREIFFTVSFLVVGGIFSVMQWRGWGSFAVRNIIAWIAAILGLVQIFSMSHIYMISTEPAWDSIATPISFFTTAFLLGSLAIGTAMVVNYNINRRQDQECEEIQCGLLRDSLRWISIAAVALLGVEMVLAPLYISTLAAGASPAQESANLMFHQYGAFFALRLILVFIGAGILGVFIYRNAISPGRENILGNLTYSAFTLVLIAEVLNRFLFYATRVRLGLF